MTPSTNNDDVRKLAESIASTAAKYFNPSDALFKKMADEIESTLRTLAPQPSREALGKRLCELMYKPTTWGLLFDSEKEDLIEKATQFAASLKGKGGCEYTQTRNSFSFGQLFSTSCGIEVATKDGMNQQRFKFCPFCGQPIKEGK